MMVRQAGVKGAKAKEVKEMLARVRAEQERGE
jgi:hypothetical protein